MRGGFARTGLGAGQRWPGPVLARPQSPRVVGVRGGARGRWRGAGKAGVEGSPPLPSARTPPRPRPKALGPALRAQPKDREPRRRVEALQGSSPWAGGPRSRGRGRDGRTSAVVPDSRADDRAAATVRRTTNASSKTRSSSCSRSRWLSG